MTNTSCYKEKFRTLEHKFHKGVNPNIYLMFCLHYTYLLLSIYIIRSVRRKGARGCRPSWRLGLLWERGKNNLSLRMSTLTYDGRGRGEAASHFVVQGLARIRIMYLCRYLVIWSSFGFLLFCSFETFFLGNFTKPTLINFEMATLME